ncbi:MAG: tape measure protein [Cyanobacteriota bacterium]
MATTLDAVLKIAAQVTGVDRIANLTDQMGRAEKSAGALSRSSGVLGAAMSGLGGQLAALASAGAIIAFAGGIIKAGDEAVRLRTRIETLAGPLGEVNRLYTVAGTAAQRYGLSNQGATTALADLYSRLRPMGLELKDVETTFNGLMTATRRAGLSMLDAKAAALQLGQAIGSGRLQGDELRALLERLPGMAQALADAFNRVARSNGLELISKEQAKKTTEALKEGERQQIANLKNSIEEKKRLIKGETDDLLREIERRYEEIEKRINDSFDDVSDQEARRETELSEQRLKRISEQTDEEVELIRERYEDQRREMLRGEESIAEDQKVAIERRLKDQEEEEIQSIQDRARALSTAEQNAASDERKRRSRLARDARSFRLQELQDQRREEERQVKDNSERRLEQLKASQEKELAAIKEANVKAQAQIVARTAATAGDIKKLGEAGLLSARVSVEAMKIFSEQAIPPPTALQLLTKAFEDMRLELANQLFPMVEQKMPVFLESLNSFKAILIELKPTLEVITAVLVTTLQILNGLVTAFQALPEPIQNLIGILVNLRIVMGLLGAATAFLFGTSLPAILTTFGVQLIVLLAKIELAFTGLSVFVTAKFVPALTLALSGFLSWMAATFVPAMIGFFSGPAGWITLAVAALLIAFRDPIIKAIQFVIEEFKKLPAFLAQEASVFPKKFEEAYTIPVQKAFQSSFDNIKKGWSELMKGLESRARQFAATFSDIFGSFLNSNFQKLEQRINFFIDSLNRIARAIPGNTTTIPRVNVPELGDGGYATGEAVVRIAERGEPEYVIPERKMQRAAINVLRGYTGIDVLNNRPSLPAETPPARNVTIQIKPNYVRFNGDEFVKASEFNQIINRVFSIMSEPEAQEAIRF